MLRAEEKPFRYILDSAYIHTIADSENVTTASLGVGDAVGVDNRKWFVAVVGYNTEKVVRERLEKARYECYVASQKTVNVWKNGRKSVVDKVIIPSLVFVKCTEQERRQVVTLPYINRFMTNKAAGTPDGLAKPSAVVPQSQIDLLRFMLGQSDVPVTFVDAPFKVNDRVVVIRGGLKGIQGEVIKVDEGKSDVIVRIDLIGAAKMTIDSIDLELVK